MDDIWIISWFNHTAFDANPIWKSPIWLAQDFLWIWVQLMHMDYIWTIYG